MATPSDDTHTRLTALANRLARLTPDWNRPERFHEAKSELKAEVRAIANSPAVVKRITRFVRIETPPQMPVPAPIPATAPIPAPAPAPAVAVDPAPRPGSMPLILTPQEREILRHAVTTTTGGFKSGFTRWHRAVDPVTGVLILPPDDLKRVWEWGSRPWKGGGQSYARKIFWRSVGGLFSTLNMIPETGNVVARPNPHRRCSKKSKPENPEGSRGDTPPQDAQDGTDADSRPAAPAQAEGLPDTPGADPATPLSPTS
jgi:hypothetical protein